METAAEKEDGHAMWWFGRVLFTGEHISASEACSLLVRTCSPSNGLLDFLIVR
jgi:hypothetical protein